MLLSRTFALLSFRRGLASMALQLQTANAGASAAFEVDIFSYLDDVEAEVMNQSPVMTKKLSEPNRKPMIRSLLGIDEKSVFDAAVRTARKETEYARLETFARDHLTPAIAKDNRMEKVPDMPDIIADALSQAPSKGVGAFRKLGTGRIYRGDAMAMVKDVAPEILPAYVKSTEEVTEMDIMSSVIQSRRSTVGDDRIDAALRCLEDFPGCEGEYSAKHDEDEDAACPKSNGQQCEKSCIDYLETRLEEDEVLTPNVYVNHKSSLSRPKYKNGHNIRSNNNCTDNSSGIIWTSVVRAYACSEFDAVIYVNEPVEDGGDDSVAQIREIWEAKYSVSPSTLWDAVTKKASAVREIMNDDEAYLSHEGKQMRIRPRGSGSGGNDDEKLIFGIYGTELLSPQNAIGQMVAMATASALGKDPDTVLKALECGYVEVTREKALDDLDVLRNQLRRTEDDFHISLCIGC